MSRREVRCVELVELVTDWMEGALHDQERVLFEAHLAICPFCVAYVAQLRAVPALVHRQPHDWPPAGARAALLDAFRHAH
jgi:anti-sigma factor RsiW